MELAIDKASERINKMTAVEVFVKASEINVGDPADARGAVFTSDTRRGGRVYFVVSNGAEFDKAPDELVFCPKKG